MPPTYSRNVRRVPTAHARRTVRRRPATRRRRAYTRKSTRMTRSKPLTTLLKARRWAVVKNPFSLATTNPKYPDNRTMFSAGQRLQVSGQAQHGNGPHMCIVMFPGLANGILMTDNIDGTGNWWAPPYNNHLQYSLDGSQLKETSIEKWRLVSQGLRLSLVTNTEENDGWFEYIRVPVDASSLKWYIGETDTVSPSLLMLPARAEVTALTSTNMVDHVTYQSGKLRDIHRYLFTLQPTGEDHEFRNNVTDHGYNASPTVDYTAAQNQVGNNSVNQTTFSNPSSVGQWLDTSYGMVVIKVHGTQASRLLYHMVSNIEFIYDQASPLSRFHTRSYQV